MELKVIKPPSLLLLIIPTVVGLVGGLVAAYFLTGGKFRGLKLPWLRKTTQGRAQEKTRRKGRGKKGKKK
jgi:hypothetical protein